MVLENQNLPIPEPKGCTVYVAPLGSAARIKAFSLCAVLRGLGIAADMDHSGRSVKAQFKYADKLGVRYVAVLGDDELALQAVRIKNMESSEEQTLPMADFEDFFRKAGKQP